MVSRLDRDSLLLYRYDNNVNNFKEIAYKAFDTFKEENVIFKDHKLTIPVIHNFPTFLFVNNIHERS